MATVSPAGLVAGVAPGSVAITAASEGRSGTAAITVTEPEPPPASGGIGVRLVNGLGEFYHRNSGQAFVPRGTNYVRLEWQQDQGGTAVFYHSTFNVGAYDGLRADAALAAMQARGFNVVRVFLNGCTGAMPWISTHAHAGSSLGSGWDRTRGPAWRPG